MWLLWEETGEAGQGDLGLAALKHVTDSRVQRLPPIAWYLAPGVMLRKHDSGSTCVSPMKEVVGGRGPWVDRLARERHALGGV